MLRSTLAILKKPKVYCAFDEDKHSRQGLITFVIPCILTGSMNFSDLQRIFSVVHYGCQWKSFFLCDRAWTVLSFILVTWFLSLWQLITLFSMFLFSSPCSFQGCGRQFYKSPWWCLWSSLQNSAGFVGSTFICNSCF